MEVSVPAAEVIVILVPADLADGYRTCGVVTVPNVCTHVFTNVAAVTLVLEIVTAPAVKVAVPERPLVAWPFARPESNTAG